MVRSTPTINSQRGAQSGRVSSFSHSPALTTTSFDGCEKVLATRSNELTVSVCDARSSPPASVETFVALCCSTLVHLRRTEPALARIDVAQLVSQVRTLVDEDAGVLFIARLDHGPVAGCLFTVSSGRSYYLLNEADDRARFRCHCSVIAVSAQLLLRARVQRDQPRRYRPGQRIPARRPRSLRVQSRVGRSATSSSRWSSDPSPFPGERPRDGTQSTCRGCVDEGCLRL